MPRQKLLMLSGIAGAAVLAVLLGLFAAFHDRIGLPSPFSGATAPTSQTAAGTGTEPEAAQFAFRRLEIDTSKAQAEACLVFTHDLDASGKTHYEDYLAIDPQTRIAVRVTGSRLCMAGLVFNATYSVELKTGLPSARGEKLDSPETVAVELRDRPPLVRFSGGILLPRENADGVPVTTVNIAKLKLKILRVGDRLLAKLETGVLDQTALYSYDATQIENEQSSIVWTGEMDVASAKNDAATTLIPFRQAVKNQAPGAYLIIATDAAKAQTSDFDYSSMAAQWVIDSDIGLTSFKGGEGVNSNGLTVFARAFSNVRPLSGIKLTLIARNNNILASVETDGSGRADFDPGFFRASGGDEPVAVMAYGAKGDFTFLDLRRPVFDLTDRGVGGRAAPGPVDAFVYTERGVYRPGEMIDAVAMLRDASGHAISSAPLTLVATRPDGVEFRRLTVPAASLSLGAWHWPVQLTRTAPQGRWQIAAYIDPKAPPVGRVAFDVADFVPQRLKLTLTPQQKLLVPGTDIAVRIESRFLYGAAASGLGGEGDARITKNDDPFPAFPGFKFGRDNEPFDDAQVKFTVPMTDAAGLTTATASLGDLPDVSLPLKAEIALSIYEPGGRATTDNLTLPIRTRDVWLGLRPDFDGGSVNENAKAGFTAIALDGEGRRIARKAVHYEWVREETYYSWYQKDGEWKYEANLRTRIVSGGTIDIAQANPSALAENLPWGQYRLTLTDAGSGASTSIGFWSGWAGASAGDRPDRVAVIADKQAYKPGETAHIKIAPQSDGQALVIVAGEKLYSSRLVSVPAGGTSIDVDVSGDWGAGAYVLVTHYRPLNAAETHAPVRSVGLVWLGVDQSARTLTANLGGPQKMVPRTTLSVPVSVTGLSSGEEAYVAIAAVDEGILQLTDYKSPAPADYYFGKRRLGVGMRDDYGRLIQVEKGPLGVMRSGGDGFGGRTLAVVPTITVAMFSGPVKLVDGKATISFAVPDFNGEVRLMAVVWSKDKVGSAARPVTVRDAVVGEVVLPRFLAPGDVSSAALNLNNVEGAAGNYTATLTGSGAVSIPGIVAQTTITRALKVGERALLPVPLQGNVEGIGTVSLALTGPNGFSVKRSWQIEVRPSQLPISREDVAAIAPGASWTPTADIASDVTPSTAALSIAVSNTKSYADVVSQLRWLDKYPLGCLEQTTSRAMPLLLFNDLARQAGLPQDAGLRVRIQDAVDRVLDMQNDGGGFGLWGPGGEAETWLSAFAMDFLYQAKARKFVVPDEGLTRGARFLQKLAAMDSEDDAMRAYSFYVLSREGLANLSDLRYFSDVRTGMMSNAIAPALIGAALNAAGDKARANAGFQRARQIAVTANPVAYRTGEYGSLLRDVAGATALAAEAGQADIIPALLRRADGFNMRLSDTTTQEKAWMLRAAYELGKARAPLTIDVNGARAAVNNGAVRVTPSLADLGKGLAIHNAGSAPVWRTVSVQGTPSQPLPAAASGLTLEKTFWTLDGQPADVATLKQNDRVVIVLTGRMDNNFYHRMAVIDLLPAGLEIETTLSGEEGKVYPFLGTLTETSASEARDDRYVAAFDIGSQYRPPADAKKPEPQPQFHLAYIARAVAAGHFAMPAAQMADMYAPAIMARTTLGQMAVSSGE